MLGKYKYRLYEIGIKGFAHKSGLIIQDTNCMVEKTFYPFGPFWGLFNGSQYRNVTGRFGCVDFISLLPSKSLVCGGFEYRTATGRFGGVEFHYSTATLKFDVRCNTVIGIFNERS